MPGRLSSSAGPARPGASARRRLRAWSVRHARQLERVYGWMRRGLLLLRPVIAILPERWLEPPLSSIERLTKRLLFGCRMCGTCILGATGMACPMNCPKGLRNGPCGGVRGDGNCEVDAAMACVWLQAWDGAQRMQSGWRIGVPREPLDSRTVGRSTWLAVVRGEHDPGAPGDAAPETAVMPVAARPPSPAMGPFERRLLEGGFRVTAEFNPPDTADPEAIMAAAEPLLAMCDTINVTDGAGARTHISSLGVCALLARRGHDPVLQISCRDRNRIAIQGDALGAAALGIRNVLCLTGDAITASDRTGAKAVFDLDCTSLLTTLRTLRDEGRFLSGRPIATAPHFLLGATANPCALPVAVEVARIAKKISAGAQFIQTQFCFDLAAVEDFLRRYRDRGLDRQCSFFVGVGPLDSARSARWISDHIAGVRVPDRIIARIEGAADQRREGIHICVELIQRIKEMKGVAGVHIMALRSPGPVPEIIERAGLMPGISPRDALSAWPDHHCY